MYYYIQRALYSEIFLLILKSRQSQSAKHNLMELVLTCIKLSFSKTLLNCLITYQFPLTCKCSHITGQRKVKASSETCETSQPHIFFKNWCSWCITGQDNALRGKNDLSGISSVLNINLFKINPFLLHLIKPSICDPLGRPECLTDWSLSLMK